MTEKMPPLWDDPEHGDQIMTALRDVRSQSWMLVGAVICGSLLSYIGIGAELKPPYPFLWLTAGLVLIGAAIMARFYVRLRLRRLIRVRPLPEEVSTLAVAHNAGKLLLTLTINREASVTLERLGAAYDLVGRFVVERGDDTDGECRDGHYHIAEN